MDLYNNVNETSNVSDSFIFSSQHKNHINIKSTSNVFPLRLDIIVLIYLTLFVIITRKHILGHSSIDYKYGWDFKFAFKHFKPKAWVGGRGVVVLESLVQALFFCFSILINHTNPPLWYVIKIVISTKISKAFKAILTCVKNCWRKKYCYKSGIFEH